jgi:hypothetical protein
LHVAFLLPSVIWAALVFALIGRARIAFDSLHWRLSGHVAWKGPV